MVDLGRAVTHNDEATSPLRGRWRSGGDQGGGEEQHRDDTMVVVIGVGEGEEGALCGIVKLDAADELAVEVMVEGVE